MGRVRASLQAAGLAICTMVTPSGLDAAAWADPAGAAACRAKAVSTIDIEDCPKAALAEAEARLEAAYAKALAALPADRKAKLVEAERRWVSFRGADCGAYYGNQTGTIAGIEAGDCLIQHANDRVRDLATFSEP